MKSNQKVKIKKERIESKNLHENNDKQEEIKRRKKLNGNRSISDDEADKDKKERSVNVIISLQPEDSEDLSIVDSSFDVDSPILSGTLLLFNDVNEN